MISYILQSLRIIKQHIGLYVIFRIIDIDISCDTNHNAWMNVYVKIGTDQMYCNLRPLWSNKS